jgi:RNA polymerase sigma-70 factor (ECF subfamily)
MDQVYKEHSRLIYRYLYSLCKNEHLAEELTQETFYRAINSVDRFDGSCKVSTWMCSIAKHIWLKHIEKQSKNKNIPLTEELAEVLPDKSQQLAEKLDNQENRLMIFKAIKQLQNPAREIVYLRLLGELSFADIGKLLDMSENTARVTFFRAKTKLAKIIGKENLYD